MEGLTGCHRWNRQTSKAINYSSQTNFPRYMRCIGSRPHPCAPDRFVPCWRYFAEESCRRRGRLLSLREVEFVCVWSTWIEPQICHWVRETSFCRYLGSRYSALSPLWPESSRGIWFWFLPILPDDYWGHFPLWIATAFWLWLWVDWDELEFGEIQKIT